MSMVDPDQTIDGARPGAALTIDVMFDFVCPWCLIGKRQLDRALTRLAETAPDVRPRVTWHGVQLLPDTPLAGTPYQAFYVARLGSEAAIATRQPAAEPARHASTRHSLYHTFMTQQQSAADRSPRARPVRDRPGGGIAPRASRPAGPASTRAGVPHHTLSGSRETSPNQSRKSNK